MLDVNVTVSARRHSEAKVGFKRRRGSMGREVFYLLSSTVDLPSVWHSMGFVGQAFSFSCLVGEPSTIKI